MEARSERSAGIDSNTTGLVRIAWSKWRDLVRQLRECDSPHTCPHGRPTMIHHSSYHLEREFGRRK